MSLRRLAYSLLVLGILAPGSPAHAGPTPSIAIELQSIEGDLPAYVCISVPLVHEPLKSADGVVALAELAAFQVAGQQTFRTARDGELPRSLTLREVLKSLARPDDTDRPLCSSGPSRCQPSFPEDLSPSPSQRWLVCAANRQRIARSAFATVALLRLDVNEGAPPMVSKLDVVGSTAILGFLQPPGAIMVSTVGGHYLARSAQTAIDGRLTIPLEPLCVRRAIELPATPLRDVAKVRVVLEGEGQPSCEGSLDLQRRNRTSVMVPARRTQQGGGPLTLRADVTDVNPHDAKKASWLASFVTRWSEARPPAAITLRSSRVTFDWRRHCLFEGDGAHACPDADLREVGAQCVSELVKAENVCHYVCSSSANSFDLPALVHFRSADDAWTDTLRAPHQGLTEFVAWDERWLRIDYPPDWYQDFEKIVESPWQRINYLDVRSPGGATYRVRVAPGETRLRIPGLACADHIAYRYIGDRPYTERPEKVTGGSVKLLVPSKLAADTLTFGISLGAGGYTPWRGDPFRLYGVVDAIVSLNVLPTQTSGWPKLFFLRPWFEVRVGYILSAGWYLGVGLKGGELDGFQRQEALYSRFTLNPAVVFPLPGDFYAGFTTGGMFGNTFLMQNRRVLPTNASFLWGVLGGYRPGHGVIGIEGTARLAAPEELAVFGTDFKGTVVSGSVTKTSFFGDLRLRIGW